MWTKKQNQLIDNMNLEAGSKMDVIWEDEILNKHLVKSTDRKKRIDGILFFRGYYQDENYINSTLY